MKLWKTRHHSMEVLAKDFKKQREIIEQSFEIIDECIDIFNSKANNNDYYLICGISLAKARNYALGMYSLILDGLGQEAGALMRPVIEYFELLRYFRLDPNRVEEAIKNKLPKAGEISKLIEGKFRDLRTYLNENASHGSFSSDSTKHVFDESNKKIIKEQTLKPKILFYNMGMLFVSLFFIGLEAINSLQTVVLGIAEKQGETILKLREEGLSLFALKGI